MYTHSSPRFKQNWDELNLAYSGRLMGSMRFTQRLESRGISYLLPLSSYLVSQIA